MNRFFGRISVRYASGMRFCQFHDQTSGLRLGAQLSDGSVADISAQYPDLKVSLEFRPICANRRFSRWFPPAPKEFQKWQLLFLLPENLLLIASKWRQRFTIPRKSSASVWTTPITVPSKTWHHQKNQLFSTNFHLLWSATVMPSSSPKLAAILVSHKRS